MNDHILDMAGAPLDYDAVVSAHRIAWTEGLKAERIRHPPGLLDGLLDELAKRSTSLGPPVDIQQIVTTYGVLKLEEDHEADPGTACLAGSDDVFATVKIINIGSRPIYVGKQIKDATGSDCEDGLARDGRCMNGECAEHREAVVDPCPCGVWPGHEKGASLSRANLFVQFDEDTALFALRTVYQAHIQHGGSWYYLDMEGGSGFPAGNEHVILMRPPTGGKLSPAAAAELERAIEKAAKSGGLIIIDSISEETADGEA